MDNLKGVPFAKMTGSGNDFVFFDGREVSLERVTSPEMIKRICHRNNGIGADGVVVLEPQSDDGAVRIHYFNSDGSPADLCGNATLCSTALAAELGMASAAGMRLVTGAGVITSRFGALPEIDFQPVMEVAPAIAIELAAGEQRIGFAVAGIPHLVVLCESADVVALTQRGPGLRWHPLTGGKGANVNWVSPLPGGLWRYRTFERGVEGETLACGTGAVATAILLAEWGLTGGEMVTIRTSSGRDLRISLRRPADAEGCYPTLCGEGRVVFRGTIESL
jgi:diaminopimelate epimerase